MTASSTPDPLPDRPACSSAAQWRAAAAGATLRAGEPVRRQRRSRAIAPRRRRRHRCRGRGGARRARDAAGDWGRLTAAERGRLLAAIGRKVLDNVELLARLEALDVGKPLKQGRADAIALARYLEFYGGAADKVHGETLPYLNGYTALTLREPHGVTGHIVPWNYPMQIVGRSVGAALAMGNACVLKPAEEACLTVLAFARIAPEAGLPAGALNVVTGLGEEAGAALSAHPGRQPPLVHRLGRDRRAGADRGGEERGAGDARARRQEPAGRLRRCRPRRGAAVPRQRRHPERRADLLGGVAHPGRAAGVRRGARAHGRALPRAAGSDRRSTTSTSAR